MRNLLAFFFKYNYWLVFAICEIISIVLLIRFNSYQRSVWFTSANTSVAKVYEWQSELSSFLYLKTENRLLTNQNIVLQQRIAALTRELEKAKHKPDLEENRLNGLLGRFQKIDAQVIANSVTRHNNYMTINKGALHGVKPDMGVACGRGVVGVVYMVGPRYSIVMPLLNSKSSISCRIRGTSYFGNLTWSGKHQLYVTMDMPRHVKIEVGQVVETSAHSSLLPEGLFVGRVSQISDSDDGLFYRVEVHLGVDFANLREVCVMHHENMEEIQELEQEWKEVE